MDMVKKLQQVVEKQASKEKALRIHIEYLRTKLHQKESELEILKRKITPQSLQSLITNINLN